MLVPAPSRLTKVTAAGGAQGYSARAAQAGIVFQGQDTVVVDVDVAVVQRETVSDPLEACEWWQDQGFRSA